MEKPNDYANGNIGTFSWLKATSSGQLVYLLQVPFNGGFSSESELNLNDILDFFLNSETRVTASILKQDPNIGKVQKNTIYYDKTQAPF